MYHELVMGAIIGVWAFLYGGIFTHRGEVLGWWGVMVNRFLSGSDNPPDPTTLRGIRHVVYKYTYCPVCIAGAGALGVAFFQCSLISFFYLGATAMLVARILEQRYG